VPRKRLCWIPLAILAALCAPSVSQAAGSAHSGGGPVHKKLIQTGWDRPTPSVLRRNLAARESLPFDGMAVTIIGVDDAGEPVRLRDAGHGRPWKRSWFQAQVDTLRQIRSDKLTDLFAYVDLSPPREEFVDAFDDAGWEQIAEHLRIAAWIAREGGLKGIMFDPEAYRGSVIKYSSRLHEERSFEDYSAQVRQRGRQMMEAMASEYPDMTFFTLFMHSGIAMGALGLDPRAGLERSSYSLYPAFINGWLDAVPPQMGIVDGFEMAYPHSSELQYLKHANAMRNTSLALVDPANRATYRAQVQTGLAIYLDAYVKYPAADVHADVLTDPPLEGTSLERLTDAVISAFEVVDEYVWVFCESYRWLPQSPHARGATGTWEETWPGVTEALRVATVPEERARARAEREFRIRQRKAKLRGVPMRNLVANGDFNNGQGPTARPAVTRAPGRPATVRDAAEAWEAWQGEGSGGTIARASTGRRGFGSAELVGVANGGYVQRIEVTPFRFYKVMGWVRAMGRGAGAIQLRWLDGSEEAIAEPVVLQPGASAAETWDEISGVVRSPERGHWLELRLSVAGQASEADVMWFDDIEVFRISVN